MTAIINWTAIIFEQHIMLKIINTVFHFEDLNAIDLKYPTAFLKLTVADQKFIIAFTFDSQLIQHLHNALTEGIDYSDEELQNIFEAVAADMLNIIIGNATVDMPNNYAKVEITPPRLIKHHQRLLRKNQANFFGGEVITSLGNLSVFGIEPVALFNEQLDYIDN